MFMSQFISDMSKADMLISVLALNFALIADIRTLHVGHPLRSIAMRKASRRALFKEVCF
jgi:DMSO reductase anchor subunit